jgi:stage II sporulation protein D
VNRLAGILLLAVAAGCGSTAPPPDRSGQPPTPPAATATPVPAATPTPEPTPVPIGPKPTAVDPGIPDTPVRILLKRSSGTVALPQPGRAYRAEVEGRALWLWGPLEITAVSERAWQVGAWSSRESAEAVVVRLEAALGDDVRVWRETTETGLERVRVRWSLGEPEDAAEHLARAGFPDAMRVTGGAKVRVSGRAGGVESGTEIALIPAGEWPTALGGRTYRGIFRARTGAGGLLVINELGMEDYLRGVVPVEMGPYVFPELEALKAQAVAARTYAVAHLGDHDDEGWDLCATPACQAYHGAGAEHSLSDRAIAETAGLIAVFDGEPIDAMYTSTCGGHTEDSSELFSGRAQPYLTGIACEWDRPIDLSGEGPPVDVGNLAELRRWIGRRALGFGDGEVGPAEVVVGVARLGGGETRRLPSDPELDEWTAALLAAGGLDGTGPLADGEGADRLIRLADLFDIPLGPTTRDDWRNGWHLEAGAAVLELTGVISADAGEVVPHPDGAAFFPRRAPRSEPVPQPVPLFWRWRDTYGGAAELQVLPGSSAERIRVGERTLALVAVRSGGGGDADRRSAWRSWAREKSWAELAAQLGEPDLERIEIVRRGRSGRVVGLAVIDASGGRRLITGFDVRRALDLPETLFEMQVRTGSGGERTVRFLGRGWGHGVGLCQNGAYGLARAGMTFDRILRHYYTGIDIGPWKTD